MPDTTDRRLIFQYVRHRDHGAFARLVHRYIALVRSAAMRQTRDPALADDVTQAAMIVLARRAREIPRNVALASWLYTVTHHLSRNALKARSRRMAHESIAASNRREPPSPDRELREVLDAAIARLPEIERGGVVLQYFNDCTHEQIADAMGMTSEAVRKRVSRALVKMRGYLTQRGFEVSTPALSNVLHAESGHATSSALAVQSVVSVALLSASEAAVASSAPVLLANGILGATKSAVKWKIAASIALVSAGFAGIASIPVTQPAAQATNGTMLGTMLVQSTAPAGAPATQPSAFVATVTPEIRLEPLGCAPHPADGDQWFGIDGKPIAVPNEKLLDNQLNTESRPDRQIAFLIYAPSSTRFVVEIPGAYTSSVNMNRKDDEPASLVRARFGLNDPVPDTLSISFNVSTSDWRTIATADLGGPDPVDVDADGLGPITVHPAAEDPRWGTHVDIRHPRAKLIPQLIAIDANGKEHVHHTINNNSDGGNEVTSSFLFGIPAKAIRSVKLQVREYDKRVEYTNIAMQADQQTEPQVVVKDLKK